MLNNGNKSESICRVYGLEYNNFYLWGEDGNLPSFDVYFCCGTEFGYKDSIIEGIRTN